MVLKDLRRVDVSVTLRWQQIGDIGKDGCWKPGLICCSSKEGKKEEEDEDYNVATDHHCR